MLADRPFRYGDHLDKIDGVLFETLTDILVHVELLAQDAREQGVMIGIKGDWGTGKTSILKAMAEYFSKARQWPVVFFDAWKYQEEDAPILPLLGRLREVCQGDESQETQNLLNSLMEKLATTGTLAMDIAARILTGRLYGESKGLEEIKKDLEALGRLRAESYARYDETFNLLRELVKKILQEGPPEENHGASPPDWNKLKAKVREITQTEEVPGCLLILVDDLDRLLPDRGVKLLEAIRFYLSIPQTVVVMGVNDRVLAPALENHYRNASTSQALEACPFSGDEFMEKLFQWSVELPHHSFNPSLHTTHFHQALERLGVENFPDKVQPLLEAMDPLPHRKWVRIANRWEALLLKADDPAKALVLALFQECFPKAENFMRRFPLWSMDFPNFYLNTPPHGDEVKKRVIELIQQDTTHLDFPQANLDRLLQAWDELGGPEP